MKYSGEVRPWGDFLTLAENVKCTVKMMAIQPNQQLSVQYHKKRDQMYYVFDQGLWVEYTPAFIADPNKKYRLKDLQDIWEEHKLRLTAGPHTKFYFPRGMLHTCGTKKDVGAWFLDVAFGVNDEEDIIRIHDKYGRE